MVRVAPIAGAVAAVALGCALLWLPAAGCGDPAAPPAPARPAPPPANYVGSKSCAPCHPAVFAAWKDSQHARAMQVATESTVLGDFGPATFSHGGVTSTFFKKDGKFHVRTDGPTGAIEDFEIRYTFGVEPLQQFLVAMPKGRLQALGIAWDTRAKEAGGQRWFHLYPAETPSPGDPLHWTGIDQNWNYQCADCHSTNLRKNHDPATGAYATTWSEINVACEACHGPASHHLEFERKQGDWRAMEATRGLVNPLPRRATARWEFLGGRPTAMRTWTREAQREIDACARCHARRGQFSDDVAAGDAFHDAFRPSLVEPPLYHVDGQQRDEVYTYGSFLQSRMYENGVTCSDCHEPHGGKLRAQGNALCAGCHQPAVFDVPEHHRHPAGSPGSRCVACHMPETTYMVVDPRHDHGFRVPRPDVASLLGTPDACASCHADRPAGWTAATLRSWSPKPAPAAAAFGDAMRGADRGGPGAADRLLAIVEDRGRPAFVRASALLGTRRLQAAPPIARLEPALEDGDRNVRMAAVLALSDRDLSDRVRLLGPRLFDPARVVRMDAARALGAIRASDLPNEIRPAFERALAEWIAAQEFNADRPESHLNLGALAEERGRLGEAEAAFRKALAIDPTFVPAAANLADVLRAAGRESEADAALRASLERNPGSAVILHALGLSLVRQGRSADALPMLEKAARGAPETARFAFVYAVALHDGGKPLEAIDVLEAARARHPFDWDVLSALMSYEREAGRLEKAAERERVLRQLRPEAFEGR